MQHASARSDPYSLNFRDDPRSAAAGRIARTISKLGTTIKQDMTTPDQSSSSDIAATKRVHYTEEFDNVAKGSCFPNFFFQLRHHSSSTRSISSAKDHNSSTRSIIFAKDHNRSARSISSAKDHNRGARSISSANQTVASVPGTPNFVSVRPLDERLLRRRCDRVSSK